MHLASYRYRNVENYWEWFPKLKKHVHSRQTNSVIETTHEIQFTILVGCMYNEGDLLLFYVSNNKVFHITLYAMFHFSIPGYRR
jgi:hypothetical protein